MKDFPDWEPTNLNQMYDPVKDSWTIMAPMMSGTWWCASVVMDGKIYVLSGMQVYDPQTNTWNQGPRDSNQSFYDSGGTTTGVYAPKRIYSIGADSGQLLLFNPETGKWSTGTPIPTPRSFIGVAVVDDLLYAIGGDSVTGVNERYTPFGYSAKPLVTSSAPTGDNFSYTIVGVVIACVVIAGVVGLLLYHNKHKPKKQITVSS
jgi:hypothetical protein